MLNLRGIILGSSLALVIGVSIVMEKNTSPIIYAEEYRSQEVKVPYLDKNIDDVMEGSIYVSENEVFAEDEQVFTNANGSIGKTVVVTRAYDGLDRETIRSEQRTLRNGNRERFGNGTGYSKDSTDVGNTVEVNNESTVQEESTEPDSGGMETSEVTESVSELVEPELSAPESVEEGNEGGDDGQQLIYLGNWCITFYCPCESCCGEWATGYTASGSLATEGRTIACGNFDFGTKLYIDGLGYFVVEDRGVSGEAIDVFVNDHQYALDLGEQYRDVYLILN